LTTDSDIHGHTSAAFVAVKERMLMSRNAGNYRLVLILGLVILLGFILPVYQVDYGHKDGGSTSETPAGYLHTGGTPHAPIAINGDANFSAAALAEGWPGNGSAENPYVIDNLEIDLGGGAGHCINISNTRAHFTIGNCNLTSASIDPGSGVYLYNATNGMIIGNVFADDYCGVCLLESDSNTVADNTCSSNQVGIRLIQSESNLVANNTCSSNVQFGISIGSSNPNTVANNTCNSNYHGIYVHGSDSITVSNNTCSENAMYGIYVYNSVFNTVFNNTCSSVDEYGIFLQGSDSNEITYNTCFGTCPSHCDFEGLYLSSSDSNVVSNNTFSHGQHTMTVSASSNIVSWNIFLDIWDEFVRGGNTGGNVFDYNYWDDYIGVDENGDGFGDTPRIGYYVDDHYPLMYIPTPPTWMDIPIDQNLEFMDSPFYSLNVSSLSPVTWSVNDTVHFTIDENGIIESPWILPLGEYPLLVRATNIYGSTISASFVVNVTLDADAPPGWLIAPTDQEMDWGEEFDYQIVAIDPSGIDYWELNDTTHFSLTSTRVADSGTARIRNSSSLEIGTYGLLIHVYDSYGNRLSATIRIMVKSLVQDTTSPIWIIAPTNQTLENGIPFELHLGAWDESGIDHWWINDTAHFAVDEYGVIRNRTSLAGSYALNVTVYDTLSNALSAIFTVTIEPPREDVTPPVWVVAPADVIIEEDDCLAQRLGVWDESGVDHWWLNDSTYFSIDTNGVLTNATLLGPGTYRVEVRAYDPFDNYCTGTLAVTVLEETVTSTATATTSETSSATSATAGENWVGAVLAFGLGAGTGGIVVVVAVLLLIRKRS
jgi:parallel beta-helix repeat protein